MLKKIIFLCLFIPTYLAGQRADMTFNKSIRTIAFGSCSKQDMKKAQLWDEVNETNPDLWIWLGDNIYGDSEDVSVLQTKYTVQKSHRGYQELLKSTQVLGIWDDHDYGANDAGKEFPSKEGSKQALFQFLDVPEAHPAWRRTGAYQSYTFEGRKKIKIILLDARYFRDSLKWEYPAPEKKVAIENKDGDILGEDQWKWFESQLSESGIDFFIVCSGIQVIPEEHAFEKWANFPKERSRLLSAIAKLDKPLILLSGDRHISEVSKWKASNLHDYTYEFTSSSLTSPWGKERKESNQYREKEIVYKPNFGSLIIDWESDSLQLNVKFIGKDDVVYQTHTVGL